MKGRMYVIGLVVCEIFVVVAYGETAVGGVLAVCVEEPGHVGQVCYV